MFTSLSCTLGEVEMIVQGESKRAHIVTIYYVNHVWCTLWRIPWFTPRHMAKCHLVIKKKTNLHQ